MPSKGESSRPKLTLGQAFHFVLNVKEEEGKSDFTLKDYRLHLKAFRDYLEGEGIAYVEEVEPSHMRAFMKHERERGLNQRSQNNRIRYIRSGFNILTQEELFTKENPTQSVNLGKEDISSFSSIPDDLLKRLLPIPDQSSLLGMRNYVLMLVILDCGIRPSELLAGEVTDWSEQYYTVRAEVAKTGETRILPLSVETRKALYRYLTLKGDWGEERLFPNHEGEAFHTGGFRTALRKLCDKAGFTEKEKESVYPYAFRHTFAVNYLKAGGNVFDLQDLLGHSDLTMTKRYVKLLGSDLLHAHKKVQPLSKYVKTPKKRRRV